MRVTRVGWAGTRTAEYGGGQVDEHGEGWRHFRAPDGNPDELTSG
jgi:hypothetical protein